MQSVQSQPHPSGDEKLLCSREEKHDLELRNQAATFQFITEFFLDDAERSPYTLSVILELHRLTIQDIYPCSGEFRTALNQVEITGAPIAPVHPSQVRNEINDLLEEARCHSRGEHMMTDDMVFAAKAFHRFLAIHPFNGGNGRVARCFLILMLYDLGILVPPMHIFEYIEKRRRDYIPALQAADRGNITPLTAYLARGSLLAALEFVLSRLEQLDLKDYVLRRVPRDQRRLCDPRINASFTDAQLVREMRRLRESIGKVISRLPVQDT
jgi:Fic family protein